MEGKIAKEIYSESLHHSELELGSTPAVNDDFQDEEDGSLWGGSDEELDKSSDLDREWKRRHEQFLMIGYRDGIIAGKEAIAQDGFNIGFKESVFKGYNWGIIRGFSSALAFLPKDLRERLIETQENRNKFQSWHESVQSFSTTDALKLFHDDIMTKKAVEQSLHAKEATSEKESLEHSLENYIGQLESLLLESPAIESRLSVK